MEEKTKDIIKLYVAIAILVIILIIVAIIMIKYEVEGDKNMPFNLSKIITVSTVEGIETEGKNKWNFDVYQNNDIYFFIDKNEKYLGNDTHIEKVTIENIKIDEAPQVGEIKAYMPNNEDGRLYSYLDKYIVDNKLEYKGANKSNPKTLEIGGNGGSLLIRFANTDVGKYFSNKDTNIVHDGTLLKKMNISPEDTKFTVSFDFIIEVSHSKYKARIQFNLPHGDIQEKGTEITEKTDMNDVIFKRL